jgi:hypothetical protein
MFFGLGLKPAVSPAFDGVCVTGVVAFWADGVVVGSPRFFPAVVWLVA